jgi:hypothetical protein
MDNKEVEELARILYDNNPDKTCPYEELPKDSKGKNGYENYAQKLKEFIERAGYHKVEPVQLEQVTLERERVHTEINKYFAPIKMHLGWITGGEHPTEDYMLHDEDGDGVDISVLENALKALEQKYEPAQLEVLGDEKIAECKYAFFDEKGAVDSVRIKHPEWLFKRISQATIAHNEAKGQLFRRIE